MITSNQQRCPINFRATCLLRSDDKDRSRPYTVSPVCIEHRLSPTGAGRGSGGASIPLRYVEIPAWWRSLIRSYALRLDEIGISFQVGSYHRRKLVRSARDDVRAHAQDLFVDLGRSEYVPASPWLSLETTGWGVPGRDKHPCQLPSTQPGTPASTPLALQATRPRARARSDPDHPYPFRTSDAAYSPPAMRT